MNDEEMIPATPILLSIRETAHALSCSTRTVYRLIQEEELPAFPLRRRKLVIPADELKQWLQRRKAYAHNTNQGTRSVVAGEEKKTCPSIDVKILPFGGSPSPTQAARELGNLLAPKTKRRLKPLKQNGD